MSFLSDIVDSISGNGSKRATGQALVEVAKELEDLEMWIEQADIDFNNVHVSVGREIIENDIRIYEKANKLIIRLQKSLSTRWSEELGVDIHRSVLNLLVMKYVIAAGEGFEFNSKSVSLYPEIAQLASQDEHGLLMHFQEAVDSVQELYEKHFPRG